MKNIAMLSCLALLLSVQASADLPDSPLITDDSPACNRSLGQYLLASEPWPDNTCAIYAAGAELARRVDGGFLIRAVYHEGDTYNGIPTRTAFLRVARPSGMKEIPQYVVYTGMFKYLTGEGIEKVAIVFKPYVSRKKRH